jgi:protein TonB
MVAIRSLSMMASLVLTAGLIGTIILGLSYREGTSHREPGVALALFDIARTVDRARSTAPQTEAEPDRPQPQEPISPSSNARRIPPLPTDMVPVEVSLPTASPVPAKSALVRGTAPREAASWATPVSDAARPPSKPQPARAAPTLPRQGSSNYAARILAWLERHKRFPEGQVRDALDATVLVAFTIDRRGRANDLRVVSGSGIGWLDTLALRQVRSASPFPRPPESAEVDVLKFEVPMRYRTG